VSDGIQEGERRKDGRKNKEVKRESEEERNR
jgi:hypothetical protein